MTFDIGKVEKLKKRPRKDVIAMQELKREGQLCVAATVVIQKLRKAAWQDSVYTQNATFVVTILNQPLKG